MPTPKYLIQLSGGVGSYAAARRLLDGGVPQKDLVLMFADVLGEHPDTYRFLIEAAADLAGVTLRTVAPLARAALELPPLSREAMPDRKAALAELAADASREIPNLAWLSAGLAVWEVFEKERYIGNSRIDPCSRVLKRELLKRHITENHSPDECRLVLGIDATEAHRHLGAWARWRPYEVLSPLCDEPDISKEEMSGSVRNVASDVRSSTNSALPTQTAVAPASRPARASGGCYWRPCPMSTTTTPPKSAA